MNDFADSLLTLLLSWMRSFFSSILSLLQSDGTGFFAWMQDHWLPLVIVLMLLGVTADCVFYILRWRPQYVWRTRLRRLFHLQNDADLDQDFKHGYNEALTGFNFGEAPIQGLDWQSADASRQLSPYYAAVPASQSPSDRIPSPENSTASQQPPRRRRSDRYAHREPLFRMHQQAPDTPQSRNAFRDMIYPSINTQQMWHKSTDEPQKGPSEHA